jgi:hypothetical protein
VPQLCAAAAADRAVKDGRRHPHKEWVLVQERPLPQVGNPDQLSVPLWSCRLHTIARLRLTASNANVFNSPDTLGLQLQSPVPILLLPCF